MNRDNPAVIEERKTIVWELALDGLTQREISMKLGISSTTVSQAIRAAVAEIGPAERAELRQLALDRFNRWFKIIHRHLERDPDDAEIAARLIPVALAIQMTAIKTFRLADDPVTIPVDSVDELEFRFADAIREVQIAARAKEAAIRTQRALPA